MRHRRLVQGIFILFFCVKDLPAAGVMQTRPVIMPCTAPMTDGLPKKTTSRTVHTRRLIAAHTLVLMTAMEESTLAAYGSPPLNPAHPSHSSPAPANISNTLLGGKRSLSFVNLGPTYTEIPRSGARHQELQSWIDQASNMECNLRKFFSGRCCGKLGRWRNRKETQSFWV